MILRNKSRTHFHHIPSIAFFEWRLVCSCFYVISFAWPKSCISCFCKVPTFFARQFSLSLCSELHAKIWFSNFLLTMCNVFISSLSIVTSLLDRFVHCEIFSFNLLNYFLYKLQKSFLRWSRIFKNKNLNRPKILIIFLDLRV